MDKSNNFSNDNDNIKFDNRKLISIVKNTLEILYKKENYLFKCDVSERDLVFHFGRYFIEELKTNGFDLNKYSVDYEYNRDAFNEKIYKEIIVYNDKRIIIPDLLLHQRGSNDGNIIAFEFKKKEEKELSDEKEVDDYKKLKALTNDKYRYKYKLGLLIIFNGGNNYKIKKFTNGKQTNLNC